MPIANYGVLRGTPVKVLDGTDQSPHYQIHIQDSNGGDYRIAVDVKSSSDDPAIRYYVFEEFPYQDYIAKLKALDTGITDVESQPGGVALDFLRNGFFDVTQMSVDNQNIPQTLDAIFDNHIQKVMQANDCEVIALGQYWKGQTKEDQYFGFYPSSGIHDIHMNQGNSGHWEKDNGTWQDGGLFFHYINEDKWVAFFMAFESQSLNTDDSGDPVDSGDNGNTGDNCCCSCNS